MLQLLPTKMTSSAISTWGRGVESMGKMSIPKFIRGHTSVMLSRQFWLLLVKLVIFTSKYMYVLRNRISTSLNTYLFFYFFKMHLWLDLWETQPFGHKQTFWEYPISPDSIFLINFLNVWPKQLLNLLAVIFHT